MVVVFLVSLLSLFLSLSLSLSYSRFENLSSFEGALFFENSSSSSILVCREEKKEALMKEYNNLVSTGTIELVPSDQVKDIPLSKQISRRFRGALSLSLLFFEFFF